MIISASYRTDIPAFYGEWFMNRLRAGFCQALNPYNGQVYEIPLQRPDVDGFVFWTKNAGPFLRYLPEIRQMGYPFVFQYSMTGYPRALESSVVDAGRSIAHVHHLATEYGPRVVVWRYDPILFTSMTDLAFHRQNFSALAGKLEGATDEVVISFAQIYQKTKRNLDAVSRLHGFAWEDPADEIKKELTAEFVSVARGHGMQLSVCSQAAYCVGGAQPAKCVDAGRMSDVAGIPIQAKKLGNRPDCACDQSRDIGHYDTCPHGCTYCYAVQHRALAQVRYQQHDPEALSLAPAKK